VTQRRTLRRRSSRATSRIATPIRNPRTAGGIAHGLGRSQERPRKRPAPRSSAIRVGPEARAHDARVPVAQIKLDPRVTRDRAANPLARSASTSSASAHLS